MAHSLQHLSFSGPDYALSQQSATPNKPRLRRPNRAKELTEHHIAQAIPEGMQRPTHTRQVLAALEAHPEYVLVRADRRQALTRCLQALVSMADYATMTTRPTWAKLSAMLGVARRSVARYLRQLRAMGLLGVVASGRSAEYAAKGPDGERINEAAVYVLCIPQTVGVSKELKARVMARAGAFVDRCVTPPSEAGLYLSNKEVNPRTRARDRGSKSVEQKRLGVSVEQVRWNRHWRPSNRRQQLTAAWRVKTLIPHVVGRMSDRDIASCLREFFAAGWTVDDVLHALDHRPDATAWPHSGAPATKAPHRVRGWLKYRLAAWRDSRGYPVESKSHRETERRALVQRQRQAEREYQAQRQQQLTTVPLSIKERALEEMRQILSRRPRFR